ncbi:hypothetical protein EZS27_012731 [termite gut metagenome]|uniref:Uncharacterized protein n=1 Tax=termite gut metagenome TaxID=433724 RepID=A0A5J4RZN4_9ZZZZ
MRMLDGIKVALLLTVWIGFNSCEMHYTDDYFRNSDAKLCNKLWERQYIIDNELCTHQLTFRITSKGGKGTEVFIYQRDRYGKWDVPYREISYSFDWEWGDNQYESILIDHSIDGILYFDNVWARDYYLSGYLEGEEVTFRAN